MLYGMGLSGTGGQIERARLENVSNNFANLDTVGFKRDLLTVMARPVESQDVQLPSETERLFWQHDLMDKIGGGVHLNMTHTAHEIGPLEQTGKESDLALTGKGFFKVEEAGSGLDFYTRAGDFVVNQDGWLVTNDGQHFVQSAEDKAININKLMEENGAQTYSINDQGAILVTSNAGTIPTGETVGVTIFNQADLQDLTKIGGNRFRADEGIETRAVQLTELPRDERMSTTKIRQGFRETSGVEPAKVMAEMIEVTRAFERNMKMLSLQDGTLEDVIRRVGEI